MQLKNSSQVDTGIACISQAGRLRLREEDELA